MARGTWGGATDPNIFRCTIRYLKDGQHCQTGFYLRDVAINDNTEQDVANEIRDQLETPFRNFLRNSDGIEGFDARILGQDTGAFANPVLTNGASQTSDAEAVPNFVAVVLTMKSEIRKRYGQGRMFLPVPSEDEIDGNQLSVFGHQTTDPFVTALTDHFTGDPLTHDLLLVNAHGTLPARAPTPTTPGRPEIPPSWYDVVSLRLNTILSSLRSRKVGVGS